MQLMNNPDLLIQVASKLKEEKEARRIAEEQVEQHRNKMALKLEKKEFLSG